MVIIANNIWQDKLDFANRIINKELDLITQFTSVINSIKYNNYPIERLNELTNYKYCWANINNLYDILIDGYKKELKPEEVIELDGIIKKYIDLTSETNLSDLKRAKKLILTMLQKSGFHDLVRKDDIPQEFGEF